MQQAASESSKNSRCLRATCTVLGQLKLFSLSWLWTMVVKFLCARVTCCSTRGRCAQTSLTALRLMATSECAILIAPGVVGYICNTPCSVVWTPFSHGARDNFKSSSPLWWASTSLCSRVGRVSSSLSHTGRAELRALTWGLHPAWEVIHQTSTPITVHSPIAFSACWVGSHATTTTKIAVVAKRWN